MISNEYRLVPLHSGETAQVGDQIEVQLRISTRSQFEYMYLKDPKAAGFEPEILNSGWQWHPLPLLYRATRFDHEFLYQRASSW
jgi:alpha-2-macroglobulin